MLFSYPSVVWGTARNHVSGKEMGQGFGQPLLRPRLGWQKQLTPTCQRGPGKSWERAGCEGVPWSGTRDDSAAPWWTNNWRPDGELDTSEEASLDGEWSWGPDVPSQYLALWKAPKFRCNPGNAGSREAKLIEIQFLQSSEEWRLKKKRGKQRIASLTLLNI